MCFHSVRRFAQANNLERSIHRENQRHCMVISQQSALRHLCTVWRHDWVIRAGSSRNVFFHFGEPVATFVLENNLVWDLTHKSSVLWHCVSDQSHQCLSLISYGSDSWPMPKLSGMRLMVRAIPCSCFSLASLWVWAHSQGNLVSSSWCLTGTSHWYLELSPTCCPASNIPRSGILPRHLCLYQWWAKKPFKI